MHLPQRSNDPITQWTDVTPEMAEDWLTNPNVNASDNRAIRRKKVREYGQAMAHGNWIKIGAGIRFDTDGKLIDGQHRLQSVVETGQTVRMLILSEVDPRARLILDIGTKRGQHDGIRIFSAIRPEAAPELAIDKRLARANKDHTATLSAMLGGLADPVRLENWDVLEHMSRHFEAIDFAVRAVPKKRKIGNKDIRAVIARAHYHLPEEVLREFAYCLLEGLKPDMARSSVQLLYRRLQDMDGHGFGVCRERRAKAERALVAFANREPLGVLRGVPTEQFPLPEEQDSTSSRHLAQRRHGPDIGNRSEYQAG